VGGCGVAQGIGPEFKPQHHPEKQKDKTKRVDLKILI
jgi:hypothetical protein